METIFLIVNTIMHYVFLECVDFSRASRHGVGNNIRHLPGVLLPFSLLSDWLNRLYGRLFFMNDDIRTIKINDH